MGHLEGNFTPVLYIGHKVPKGYPDQQIHNIYVYINNILFIVSNSTYLDVPISYSEILNLLRC